MSSDTGLRRRKKGAEDEEPVTPTPASSEKPREEKDAPKAVSQDSVRPVARAPWRTWEDTIALWALFILALVTRFWRLEYPQEVVFDEYHFGKFANNYINRQTFFDIHPPLGKLILAAGGYLVGYRGEETFAEIGVPFKHDWHYYLLRCIPAFFGALLTPLVYASLRCGTLKTSIRGAILASLLSIFDISILVESQLVLTDSILFTMCQYSVYRFLLLEDSMWKTRREDWLASPLVWFQLVMSGVAFGLALSVKWVAALAAYGACGIYCGVQLLAKLAEHFAQKPIPKAEVVENGAEDAQASQSTTDGAAEAAEVAGVDAAKDELDVVHPHRQPFFLFYWGTEVVLKVLFLILLPLFVYLLVYFVHFVVIRERDFPGGIRPRIPFEEGDSVVGYVLAHLTPDYLNYIFWRVWNVNWQMYTASAGITQEHHWQSWYYTWPYMERGVSYWHKHLPDGTAARVYLLGNPLVWWLVLLCLVLFVLTVFVRSFLALRPKSSSGNASPSSYAWYLGAWFAVLGWLLNMVVFVPVTRCTFLYHYIPALVFGFMLVGYMFDMMKLSECGRRILFEVLVGLCGFAFIMYAPFSYGYGLHQFEFTKRILHEGWL